VALNFAQKEAIVAEVAEVAKTAYSAIGAEYRGLSVEDMTALRAEARKVGVYVRVVSHPGTGALADTVLPACRRGLGALILAFAQQDPCRGAVAEAFAKTHDKFQVKLVSVGGKLLEPSQLGALAKMPTYEEAISQLMALMKAPVQKLAATINEVPGKLVRTIAAIRDAKEAA
jgi:large subunit ribosomal protein L10